MAALRGESARLRRDTPLARLAHLAQPPARNFERRSLEILDLLAPHCATRPHCTVFEQPAKSNAPAGYSVATIADSTGL